ncbi:MAG: DUF896 domain-containing protein [Lachnospiraceae bacterium]|nr:DUF896 domain-containing protein [Lachnospiraceae bacterium]
MDEKDIKRINELYHKQKEGTLTPEEKEEQAALRKAYIDSIKNNLTVQLESISIKNPDGSITKVKKKEV